MTLKKLASMIPGATTQGDSAISIRGISHDSRSVKPGDLFVCLVGEKFDGHKFASDARARGAAALCIQQGRAETAGPYVTVPDTRKALPTFAVAVYGYPS